MSASILLWPSGRKTMVPVPARLASVRVERLCPRLHPHDASLDFLRNHAGIVSSVHHQSQRSWMLGLQNKMRRVLLRKTRIAGRDDHAAQCTLRLRRRYAMKPTMPPGALLVPDVGAAVPVALPPVAGPPPPALGPPGTPTTYTLSKGRTRTSNQGGNQKCECSWRHGQAGCAEPHQHGREQR